MKLNKEKTRQAIIDKAQNSVGMNINIAGFKKKFKAVKDLKEACEFVGVDPVYDK